SNRDSLGDDLQVTFPEFIRSRANQDSFLCTSLGNSRLSRLTALPRNWPKIKAPFVTSPQRRK
ncbi:unnamed protein product, partial [Oikopleura dioica]